MGMTSKAISLLLALLALGIAIDGQQTQPSEVATTISGRSAGVPPRLGVPDLLALSPDRDTRDAARSLAEILWNDLDFEREFALIPRAASASIPAASSITSPPLDRWRELNADGVLIGTVQRTGSGLRVEVRLFNVQTGASAFGKQYEGPPSAVRRFAHTIADELHQQQRNLRGVARTMIAFSSDRDGETMTGGIASRIAREVYITDYDGENQRRVTSDRSLNTFLAWAPDGRSVVYTSYKNGPPSVFVSYLFERRAPQELTAGPGQHWLPAWSPDGTRLAFSSTRSGNEEIYVMNRDGSNLRQLTNHPGDDGSPTWSPSGNQIAFRSDRSGVPEIYIVGADGLGLQKLTSDGYADRPTWSPAPYNEVAYAVRPGNGTQIRILDLATRESKQLTFEGTNESPSFSPNGRHIVFASTRTGRSQIFTMDRDGRNVRQITRSGTNYQPDWSR
jgi:TolB protein